MTPGQASGSRSFCAGLDGSHSDFLPTRAFRFRISIRHGRSPAQRAEAILRRCIGCLFYQAPTDATKVIDFIWAPEEKPEDWFDMLSNQSLGRQCMPQLRSGSSSPRQFKRTRMFALYIFKRASFCFATNLRSSRISSSCPSIWVLSPAILFPLSSFWVSSSAILSP